MRYIRILVQKLEFFVHSLNLSIFLNSVKSVAHNCNEHVQNGDLGEEGRAYKQKPHHSSVGPPEIVQIKLAKSQQILVHDRVYCRRYEISIKYFNCGRVFLEHFKLARSIKLVEAICEHENEENLDNQEPLNVVDCFSN